MVLMIASKSENVYNRWLGMYEGSAERRVAAVRIAYP